MKRILLFVSLLIIAANIFAQQSITGTLTNEDGKPVANVTVSVKNLDKTTTSDANGNYTIEIPEGFNTLIFKKTGFKVQEVVIASNIVNIKMTYAIVDVFDLSLEELLKLEVITASKTEQKIKDIPASVVVITKEEIEKYGYLDVSDVLKHISGLYVHDFGPGNNFGVRGFISSTYNRNIAVLVNEMELRNTYLEQNFISTLNIPVESIERIEFVRGPMSVMYGNGSFFGALNIITKNLDSKNINIAAISGGLENTGRVTLSSKGQTNDFMYSLTGSYYETDGREFELNKMTDSLPSMDTVFVKNAKSTEMFSKEIYHFDFSGQFNNFYTNVLFSHSKIGYIANGYPIIGEKPKNVFNTSKYVFGYRKTLTGKLTFDAHINMYNDEFEYENSRDVIVLPTSLQITNPVISNFREATWSGEATMFIKPLENLDILLGYFYQSTFLMKALIDQPEIGINRKENFINNPIITQSPYLKIDYWFFDKLLLEAGVRFEQRQKYDFITQMYLPNNQFVKNTTTFGENKWQTTYNFATLYQITETQSIKGIYGTAINHPAVSEYQYAMLPDEQLKPQDIQSAELIYSGLISSKLSVSLSGFYNKLNNLIMITSNETGAIGYTNSGKMETKGVEFIFVYRPFIKLELSGSFTYQTTKDKSYKEEIDAGISPNYLSSFKTSYRITKNISVALTGNYVSSMEANYVDEIKIGGIVYVPAGRVGEKVDGYFNLNANLHIENLPVKNLFFNMRGTNLFGSDIYYPNMFSVRWYKKGMYGQGRYFEATLGYKF